MDKLNVLMEETLNIALDVNNSLELIKIHIRFSFVNLGVQYNNEISLSLSEDDILCDEITDLCLERISCLEK